VALCFFSGRVRLVSAQARSVLNSGRIQNFDTKGGHIMPYLLGWLLGVPLIVLVILYLIFH
jgi:hypothetical protein